MQSRVVLFPICIALSHSTWAQPALQDLLLSRLPRPLSRSALPLSRALCDAFPKHTPPDAETVLHWLSTSRFAGPILIHARKTATRPDIPLATPPLHPHPSLAHLPLPVLATTRALSDWLALPDGQLIRFADPHGLSARAPSHFAPHYFHHLIPKSNGRLRLIEEPKPFLKHLQRRILHGILNHVPPHDAAYGFRTRSNCINAASRHAGEGVVLCFDLADFFPAIPFARIHALFRSLGYPTAVARALTHICTAITPAPVLRTSNLAARDALSNRHLPQGAPTSPAIANLCALQLDSRLSGLARRFEATYTRYADDLTFSGDPAIAPILLRAVPDIIRDAGFRLNPAKTRTMPAGTRQTVTGLIVNQHVNIPRPAYDLLKATIHHLANPADPRRTDLAFLARLSGQIAWVMQVNPYKGQRLAKRLDDSLTAPRVPL